MIEHKSGIRDEIMEMQLAMGEEADLDFCIDLDDYADYLGELSTEELYDTYSMVHSTYRNWALNKCQPKTK